MYAILLALWYLYFFKTCNLESTSCFVKMLIFDSYFKKEANDLVFERVTWMD